MGRDGRHRRDRRHGRRFVHDDDRELHAAGREQHGLGVRRQHGVDTQLVAYGPAPSSGWTFREIQALSGAAPGATKGDYIVTLLDNRSATSLNCHVSGTGTMCNGTGSVTIAQGHFVEVQITYAAPNPPNPTWKVVLVY
jgi:hypothetical protein